MFLALLDSYSNHNLWPFYSEEEKFLGIDVLTYILALLDYKELMF